MGVGPHARRGGGAPPQLINADRVARTTRLSLLADWLGHDGGRALRQPERRHQHRFEDERARRAPAGRRCSRRYTSRSHPIIVGPKNPPRLPIALISAMPAAAAVPPSSIGGIAQNTLITERWPTWQIVNASTSMYRLSVEGDGEEQPDRRR